MLNEQLTKLAEESGMTQYVAANNKYLERYGRSIVQKCMDICEQQRLKILNNPNDPSWTEHLTECQTVMEQTLLRSR
jgi:hypothetical protein